MSDLQCAARLIVVTPACLRAEPGFAQRLARERVAVVYADTVTRGGGSGASLAGILDVPLVWTTDDLTGAPDDGLGPDLLGEIADRHRGETVVVVRADAAAAPMLVLVDSDGMTSQPFG